MEAGTKVRPNFIVVYAPIELKLTSEELQRNEIIHNACAAMLFKDCTLPRALAQTAEAIELGVWLDSTLAESVRQTVENFMSVVVLDPHDVEPFTQRYPQFQRAGVLIRRKEIRL